MTIQSTEEASGGDGMDIQVTTSDKVSMNFVFSQIHTNSVLFSSIIAVLCSMLEFGKHRYC